MNQHSTMLQVACVEQQWHPQFTKVTAGAEEKRQNTDIEGTHIGAMRQY